MSRANYSIHTRPGHAPFMEAARRRSQIPRVLELLVDGDFNYDAGGNGLEGIITVVLGICNEMDGVEALLPTVAADPETRGINNRFRIAFWNSEDAIRYGGPWPGPVGRNLVHPVRPLFLNGRLVGMIRWSDRQYEEVSPQLESAMSMEPYLRRCLYPVAVGSNQNMDLSDNSPLRALILGYYNELMAQLGTNVFYHPRPRFKQDLQGIHYVEFASLYSCIHIMYRLLDERSSDLGGWTFRTTTQYGNEAGHFLAAGRGHFTGTGWEEGGNDWTTPNPWVGLHEGAQEYPSVVVANAIRAIRELGATHARANTMTQPNATHAGRQLQAHVHNHRPNTRVIGCTENPQCPAYRRAGECRHFRNRSTSAPVANTSTASVLPTAAGHAARCPTRCAAFMRSGYCTHFTDDEY